MNRLRTRRRLRTLAGAPPGTRPGFALRRPRLASVALALGAGIPAGVLAGPVAGAVVTGYALLGAGYVLRHQRAAARVRALAQALDALAVLAADLRAGLPSSAAREAAEPAMVDVPAVGERIRAAWRVADRTGAPLAELLDRLEADLRGRERVRLTAAAHAAGTRATAALLAILPLAGVAVGYGMGADPLRVLLHTPLGAGCVTLAVLLQLAGLGWTGRLARAGGSAP